MTLVYSLGHLLLVNGYQIAFTFYGFEELRLYGLFIFDVFNVSAERVPWYLSQIAVLTTYLAVALDQ